MEHRARTGYPGHVLITALALGQFVPWTAHGVNTVSGLEFRGCGFRVRDSMA